MAQWQRALEDAGFSPPDGLAAERVRVTKDGRAVSARFTLKSLPTPAMRAELERALRRMLGVEAVQARIACPALREEFLKNPQDFAASVSALYCADQPGLRPFFPGIWRFNEDGVLEVHLSDPLAGRIVSQRDVPQSLSRLIGRLFDIKDLSVVIHAAGDMQDKLSQMAEQLKAEDERLRKQLAQAAPAKEVKPICYLGKQFSPQPVPICDLLEDSGRTTIEGFVLRVETRALKGGLKNLITFDITDHTSSICCKAFVPVEPASALLKLKEGDHVAVRGDCQFDSYQKELVVMSLDVVPTPYERRMDNAPVKRIELHCHTQMSGVDGVIPAKKLIERAALWGHDAIAITDHGVTQAFPEAADAAKKHGIKVIYGVEGYLLGDNQGIVRGATSKPYTSDVVAFDLHATGNSPNVDKIIEISAVRIHEGEVMDEFETFIHPGETVISEKVMSITALSNTKLANAPQEEDAIRAFISWVGDTPLVTHDATFNLNLLSRAANALGLSLPQTAVDTHALSRALLPQLATHRFNSLCAKLRIKVPKGHRAILTARVLAKLWAKLCGLAAEKDIETFTDLAAIGGEHGRQKGGETFHIILLAATRQGLVNLNKLVSESHTKYFSRSPRIPRHRLAALREGIIIGSACEAGELFQAILNGKNDAELARIASFYDYLEIQPIGNNGFMLDEGIVPNEEALRDLNRRIISIGEKAQRPVAATCDVHFLEPEDDVFREIIMFSKEFSGYDKQAPLFFRTTEEMLQEFDYLGEETAYEVVVNTPRAILEHVEDVSLFPVHPEGKGTFQPNIEGAEETLKTKAWQGAHALYGENLPEIVEARLKRELDCIIGYGYATLYEAARLLIVDSTNNGYLVGSRGSVGSSFAATVVGITEVNPLPPHYRCASCRHSNFDVDSVAYPCGMDLPDETCPVCGSVMHGEGFDIPFEVFLGFKGDKVPDIDLNFSGEYQSSAHRFVEAMFGKENCFRAGTISTLAEKTAFSTIKKWLERKERVASHAEITRLINGCVGTKRTTGQHPGGMLIVPKGMDINEFCPVHHPADDEAGGTITTHYDFNSIHDLLVKLDVLGHDDPTMIRRLEDLTGVKVSDLRLLDSGIMSLFVSPEALGVTAEQLKCKTGTLGIPEFGTSFVRSMLEETQPTTMGELVRISGLSHGENVWLGNSQDLVREGIATLRECICTRDDIMNALIQLGMEKKMAFDIMESVRKGFGLRPEWEEGMRAVQTPEWFINCCNKIGYMFPRSHAAAYVIMALRIAWFKLYKPHAYYAAYFSIRAKAFDMRCFLPVEGVTDAIEEIAALGKDAPAKEKDVMGVLELVREMLCRGIEFLPVDLYKSHHTDFLIEYGRLLPPLGCLPDVGENAAIALWEAAKLGPYISVEELKQRSRVSVAVVDALKNAGCLSELSESSQISLFGMLE